MPPKPWPSPIAGSQPSLIANTEMSTIAATNDGVAVRTLVIVTRAESIEPGLERADDPRREAEDHDEQRP